MTSENKLYYLIDLADDQSEEVRSEIIKELYRYGFALERDLKNLPAEFVSDKMNILSPVLASNRMNWLQQNWHSWFGKSSFREKVETALDLISRFYYGIYSTPSISELLDQLSEEFRNKIPYGDELDLANFLFLEKELSGDKDDYYNPFNNNPIYALKEKKGSPLILSLIYMLIGRRLGFDIISCSFPGHFLTKIDFGNEKVFIDCFNKGKIIFENEIDETFELPLVSTIKVIHYNVSAEFIITRVINNLINSYTFIDDNEKVNYFENLLGLTPKISKK